MRPLCLLPHGTVLHCELVPLLAGCVRAVVLSIVLAGHRPVSGEQQPAAEFLICHASGKLLVFDWVLGILVAFQLVEGHVRK
jgi:hypothetical protein